MHLVTLVLAAAVVLIPGPALAQLSTRSIAVESGASVVGGARHGALALAATTWLDGDLDAVVRLAHGSAPGPEDRAADTVSGTLGLRLSLSPDPIRPQLCAEIGWARIRRDRGWEDRAVAGLVAGIEAFPVRDLSIALRAGARVAGSDVALEATLGVAAYY
jgi:hypothetical protein